MDGSEWTPLFYMFRLLTAILLLTSICEVVAKGKEHGASSEDIYGCLYFFLQHELRRFHQRIHKFRIAFRVTAFDATVLANLIKKNVMVNYDIPSSIRFDRIVTSNILDQIYVGMMGVLEPWAPLLSKSRTAAIVGYFMNWRAHEEAATVDGASKSINDEIENKLKHRYPVSFHSYLLVVLIPQADTTLRP